MLPSVSRRAVVGCAVLLFGSHAWAQETGRLETGQLKSGRMGLPAPVTVEAPEWSDKPASVTNPSGILPLATGGPFVFDPLPMASGGCNSRPSLSCTGPDFSSCSKRLYYGTNPCDDDPVLSLYPAINDGLTQHWYQHAFRMITRKKAVTEAIK